MALSRKSALTSFLTLAALALAACGSPDDPGIDPAAARAAEAAAQSEACSLLTEDEAAEFLGAPVTYVDPFKIRTFQACEWLNTEGSLNKVIQVGFFDLAVDSAIFRDLASAGGATEIEEIAGLGDEAYWNGSAELYVRTGTRVFSVSPSFAGDRQEATEIARLVIPRLK